MTHDTKAAKLADKAKRLADEYANCHYKHMRTVALRAELHAAIDALRDLAIPAGEAVAWVWQSALDKLRSGAVTHIDAWAQPEDEPGEVALYASPQPTPEASQDGAEHALDELQQWIEVRDCVKPREWIQANFTAIRAALRSPRPGRESTAQSAFAGATRLALSDDMTYDRDGNLIDARGADEADCSAQQKTDAATPGDSLRSSGESSTSVDAGHRESTAQAGTGEPTSSPAE